MRIPVIVLACAGLAAAPVSAQYFPAPPNWGFGYEHFDQIRFMKARVEKMRG